MSSRHRRRCPLSEKSEKAVTGRAVMVGLACAMGLCAFTPYNMNVVAATPLAGNQFPVSAIFVLLILVGVNALLYRMWPRQIFRPGEMLTIWTLIVAASGLPASGLMRTFIPSIVAPHYFSDAKNDWEAKVWASAPDWLKMHDGDAAKAFFVGYPRGQEHIPWGAWTGPLFFWGLFAVLFLLTSFCAASLLRRPWVEDEKFAFPLVALPLLLAEAPETGRAVNSLLRHPLLWCAVGLTTLLHGFRGLHQLYPTVPDIPLQWNLAAGFTSPPWDQIGQFDALLYPLVIGLAYLLPTDVALSLWLFFLVYKAEILVGAVHNWDMPGPLGGHSQKLFHALQAFGGAVALTFWVLYTMRRHLREVWEKAVGGLSAPQIDDSREMLSYRGIVAGLCVGYGGMALWLHFAGVPTLLIVVSLVMVTLALIVVSWSVCQAGMLFMAMPYATIDVLAPTFGTASLPVPALYTLYRAEASFIYNTRELMMPSLLNGAKAADAAQFSPRPLFRAMAVSVALGLVVSAIASLYVPYYHGGGNSLANAWTYNTGPQIPLKFFGRAASVPYPGAWTNSLHIGAGFVVVLGLLLLRSSIGFGLHPIGFITASVYATHMVWFSLFVGWFLKTLLLHYTGRRGFLGFLPFFLGLIVGDVLNAALWIVLGYLTGVGYQVMPA